MIPYPGASLPLDFARDHTGSSALISDIERRGGSTSSAAGHRVISAGQTWRLWVDPGFSNQYLEEPSLPLEVAWVVEVLSGTGTLTAADGYDPTYAYDSSVTTGHSLGTVNVTGAGTYVLPTTYTAADILGSSAVVLRLDCTAGSVDVQQVKLRAWPVGGAVGGWVSKPSWDSTTSAGRAYAGGIDTLLAQGEGGSMAAAAAALDDALAAAVAAASGPTAITLHPPLEGQVLAPIGTIQGVLTALDTYQANWTDSLALGALYGIDPAAPAHAGYGAIDHANLQPEVDWIYPPNEVYSDSAALANLLGDVTATFDPVTVTLNADASGNREPGEPAGGVFVATWQQARPAADTDTVSIPRSGAATITPAWGGATASTSVTIDPPADGMIRYIAVGLTGAISTPDISGFTPNALASEYTNYNGYLPLPVMPGVLHHPAYQVWAPGPPPTSRPVPRQWRARPDGLAMSSAPSWRRRRDTVHDGQWRGVV